MTAEEAVVKYPTFFKLGEDGVLEIYLDNHVLSSFRKCEGYFEEAFINAQGGMRTEKGRKWGLEFGQYFHKCMEYFYQGQRDNWEGVFTFEKAVVKQDLTSFLSICMDLWGTKEYDLEYFMAKEFTKTIGKNAQALGGFEGALRLFTQYYKVHWRKERFRIIGSELSFGRNKEVPVIISPHFRGYLTGRIDLIVDDSQVIGSMDHKTTAYFDGHEKAGFKPDDGQQGYCYTIQQVLKNSLNEQKRVCNHSIINHVSLREEKEMQDRFKHSYIYYTPEEMRAWLVRQQTTFMDIYNVVIQGKPVKWNTSLCNMWYYSSQCPFFELHEVAPSYRENLIKIHYELKPAWSPYNNGN